MDPPPSWMNAISNSMDCYKDRIVKDRCILLRRKDTNYFEDVIASTFEDCGSPDLVIKSNRNAALESARQALLSLPVGAYGIAKLLLNTKYHDQNSNFWSCYMTSGFFEVKTIEPYLIAYAERANKSAASVERENKASSSKACASAPVSLVSELFEQLAKERAAREAQEERIARLEDQIGLLAQKLDASRTAFENFRYEHKHKRRK